MMLRRPSLEDLQQIGRARQLHLTEAELVDMHELVRDSLAFTMTRNAAGVCLRGCARIY